MKKLNFDVWKKYLNLVDSTTPDRLYDALLTLRGSELRVHPLYVKLRAVNRERWINNMSSEWESTRATPEKDIIRLKRYTPSLMTLKDLEHLEILAAEVTALGQEECRRLLSTDRQAQQGVVTHFSDNRFKGGACKWTTFLYALRAHFRGKVHMKGWTLEDQEEFLFRYLEGYFISDLVTEEV